MKRCLQGFRREDDELVLTREEFIEVMERPESSQIMDHVGVDVEALTDYTSALFKKDRGVISEQELFELLLQLRGGNTAKVKDLVDMRKFLTESISSELRKLNEAVRLQCADSARLALSTSPTTTRSCKTTSSPPTGPTTPHEDSSNGEGCEAGQREAKGYKSCNSAISALW